MAAPGTVRVTGLREYHRAISKVSKPLKRELEAALRKVAEPVAADIRSLAETEQWGPRTVDGIRAGSSRGVPVIRQRRRKTTGAHPEFGGMQMRRAFLPGLERNEETIVRGVEAMLDDLTDEFDRG